MFACSKGIRSKILKGVVVINKAYTYFSTLLIINNLFHPQLQKLPFTGSRGRALSNTHALWNENNGAHCSSLP